MITTAAQPLHLTLTRWRWVGLTGLLIAEAMNLLDSTITTVAAPIIRAQLHGGPSTVQWVAAAYTLPFAVALVPGGRLGDVYGRRRVLYAGLLLFAFSSIGCAAADSMTVLLPLRAVQGLAAGLVIPQTIGLVKAMFVGPEVGKALSFIGPVMGLTAVAGPMLGGFLTHADIAGLSWRTVFLVNLPLTGIVLLCIRHVPPGHSAHRPGLDLLGVALASCAALGITVPIIDTDLGSTTTTVSIGLAAAAMVALITHARRLARRGKDPIVEPSLFTDRGFPAALLTSFLYFGLSTGAVFVVVLYVQDGLHRSVLASSLTVLPFSAGLAVASLIAGRGLVNRYGAGLMRVGAVCLATGYAIGALATGTATSMPPLLPVALALAGVGGGLMTVPFFTAAISRVRPHEIGSAAGLLNSVQQLGGTLGVAALGSAFIHAREPGNGMSIVLTIAVVTALTLLLSTRAMRPDRGGNR